MAAAADPAKTAPFRDRFARVAFNAFAITRPIYVFFQGGRWILRRNMCLVRTLPIKRRFQDGGLPICGEMVWDGRPGDGPIVAVGN